MVVYELSNDVVINGKNSISNNFVHRPVNNCTKC